MFQVFYLDITKVDMDVTYVTRTTYACCKPMFKMFHTYVANVSSGCFKSRCWCCTCCNGYTRMFQAFHPLSCMLQRFIRMLHLKAD
jgi:hypothetical protein